MKEKVILAYSGGLDTSVILKWLANKGFDVIAYVANVGQDEDFKAIEEKAYATGASKVYVEDLRKPLVTDYIYPALKANTIYEGTYMLGTSLARPIIAKRHIEIAKKEQISIQELCERSNMTRQGLYLKLANDDCRLSDFEKLAKGMGYEVKITLKRKYTKKTKPENE